MAERNIIIEFKDYKEFFAKMNRAARGDFRKELELFLRGLGTEFLRIVEDEIIRRKVMDTRLLLTSFHESGENNVWEFNGGELTLEVGSNVNYAAYVNDGHWTNPKGVEKRFIPGKWAGDRFIYDKSAGTGMILKQKWVEGAHYWESAIRIFERMFPELLEAKLQRWLDDYFTM